MEKFDKLTKELKLLAESILNGEQGQDIESGLLQARELYEKFLILSHLNQEMESTDMAASESIEAPSPFTAVVTEETIEIDISEEIELAKEKNIMSVPSIIVGNKRLTHIMDEQDIVDAILQGFLSSVNLKD